MREPQVLPAWIPLLMPPRRGSTPDRLRCLEDPLRWAVLWRNEVSA